jgi:hypothetical protein
MNFVMDAFGQSDDGGGQRMGTRNSDGSAWSNQSDTYKALASGSTALSMIAQIGAGNAKARAKRLQAADEWNQSEMEKVTGESQQLGLKGQLLAAVSQRDSAYAASGIDVGQGIAADTRTALTGSEVAAGRVTDLATQIRSRRHIINSLNAIDQAKQEQASGALGAVGTLLNAGMKMASIG